MGLFDDLGKKITQSGQTVINKTKDVATITSLNGHINDEEKAIQKLYAEIGEKFYLSAKDSPAEEFVSIFESIAESNAKIEEYKKEIVKIKKVKTCPNCGGECDNALQFCGTCGTELPQPEVEEEEPVEAAKFCTGCGNEVASDALFCPNCGTKAE